MLRSHFDHLVGLALAQAPSLSDLLFTVGKRPQAEQHGGLKDLDLPLGPLNARQTEAMSQVLMGRSVRLYKDLVVKGSCDLSYEHPSRIRFRVNIFWQRGSLALVLRQLSSKAPTMAGLGLPALFGDMAKEKFGLILVTGATGTGKSTSLAALIDEINDKSAVHIITLEDPVEFVHPHKRGTVNQRELGQDFDSFASGLRAALRQAPKVILVGEMRDRETVETAMQAAETGHLVLGTLHTSDTGQTINRIIGMFDISEERLIRQRLAASLKFVVSQRLMPKTGGGRVAAFEILRNNLQIREIIMTGETGEKSYYGTVESGSTFGMFTFDQYLLGLYEKDLVERDTALANATDRAKLILAIDQVRLRRGEKVSDLGELKLDLDYNKPAGEDDL
ncbi:type IV pilus twitching motility protein PilT [Fundidesulfovibrio agrisoli]|uniref:type IV pilus twitching motility protein PilT n=1 Tax=Fundidesulfovibrio agrisoli TaxID=2922717 RepID=UPI001FADE397|nr:PilT/PilU family type 4a pilus ATPase [Fundidesulfovibrio agrisoli]